MSTKTVRTATYKGKTYRLEFLGSTKFGRRAKLAFMDGSKEFWVDAALVTESTTPGNGHQAGARIGRGYAGRADCCGYPCPVTGVRCTPSNPCHDCA